ncbi:1-aminocyclopropane-1-carboxylate oxidase 5 [Sesamum angolense]|uniref:1-aminocyclopropane-1-carboxylate oxidase 5 n=1 Tax=Sesamum angolense TaxID=2727404 RepID=A0AAE2BPE2_9LAMI|nr:1-aminocyclopropane-1-carboxylate oxidase 5 [Sesamum angolense]
MVRISWTNQNPEMRFHSCQDYKTILHFFGTEASHYPPCPHPEKVNALRAHTDAGGVVLLFQDDEVKGLEILKDGVSTDVQPLKNAIVVNNNDQIEVLSNKRYKSILHRVVPQTDGQRRSIASFYNPSLKATIAPAPQLLGPKVENKASDATKYLKFVFGDYIFVYLEQKFQPKEPRFQAVKLCKSLKLDGILHGTLEMCVKK